MRTYLPLILLLVLSIPLNTQAQITGSGSIFNYHINCINGQPFCTDRSNPVDSIVFTAPEDGEMEFTFSVTPVAVQCCPDINYPQLVFGNLYHSASNNSVAVVNVNFTNTTYTAQCVKAGEQFLLVFFGERGDYKYSVTLNPSSVENDSENNDSYQTAKYLDIDVTHEGHIGYGLTIDGDLHDWYSISADQHGKLVIELEFDGPLNFYLVRNTNLTTIKTELNPSAGKDTIELDCVAQNDSFLLHVQARSNTCAGYSIYHKVIPAQNTPDPEGNDAEENATVMPNVPGTFRGNIGYGYYQKDVVDYLLVGEFDPSDTSVISVNVDQGVIQVYGPLMRTSDYFDTVSMGYYNIFVDQSSTDEVYVPEQTTVTLTISRTYLGCSSYDVSIGDIEWYKRMSHRKLNGTFSADHMIDLFDIEIDDAIFKTPNLRIYPPFEVPPGKTLEVKKE